LDVQIAKLAEKRCEVGGAHELIRHCRHYRDHRANATQKSKKWSDSAVRISDYRSPLDLDIFNL